MQLFLGQQLTCDLLLKEVHGVHSGAVNRFFENPGVSRIHMPASAGQAGIVQPLTLIQELFFALN